MENFLRAMLLAEFEHLRKRTLDTVNGMTRAQLLWYPPGPITANPIGFLLWHAARREDYHLQTRIGGNEQLWQTQGWHQRLGLDPEETGFGFTLEQVQGFPLPPLEEILSYYNQVRDSTLAYLRGSGDAALWQPMPAMPETPITTYLMARVGHEHEHWGQMDYLKSIIPKDV